MNKRKLDLWKPRISPHTIAKKLDIERSFRPDKFNEIIYWPGVIHLTTYGQHSDGLCPLYFLLDDETIVVDRAPVAIDERAEVTGYKDRLYDFSDLKPCLLKYRMQGIEYLHVLIKENIYYNHNIKTFVVVWDDNLKRLGYASDSFVLDDEKVHAAEKLFLAKSNQYCFEIFSGKTFSEPVSKPVRVADTA